MTVDYLGGIDGGEEICPLRIAPFPRLDPELCRKEEVN